MPADKPQIPTDIAAVMRIVELEAEVERLRAGRFTPDELQALCHNLHESKPGCTLEDFGQGCDEYQRRLFGRAYHDSLLDSIPTHTLPQRAMGGWGVAVVIRNTLGEVLLLRRGSRIGNGTWSVPGGWVEPTEGPTDAAVRECMEEVGVQIDALVYLGQTTYRHAQGEVKQDQGAVTTISHWYEATVWHNIPENREPDKATDMRWCALNALPSPLYGHLCEALRLEILK